MMLGLVFEHGLGAVWSDHRARLIDGRAAATELL